MKHPKVSVCMITYNHELYIKDAIEGVLMQKVNFEIELIIANDHSTDNTHVLISKLIDSHPKGHLIRYINHPENLGMMPNFIFALKQCKGNYIALCEGDDYWTDPLKLKKQIVFLENNRDYNICFHNVKLLNQVNGKLEDDYLTIDSYETTSIKELCQNNYIHTPSVVIRNNFALPNWFTNLSIGDWPLYMIVVSDKKIKKLLETMAVYRIHSDSSWSSTTESVRINKTIETVAEVKNNIKGLDKSIKLLLNYRIDIYLKRLGKKRSLIDRIKDKLLWKLN